MHRRMASWLGAGALGVLAVFAIVQNAGRNGAGFAKNNLRHGPESVSVSAQGRGRAGTFSRVLPVPGEPKAHSSAPLVILVGLAVAVGGLLSRRPRTLSDPSRATGVGRVLR
jgi:hypothetical protein